MWLWVAAMSTWLMAGGHGPSVLLLSVPILVLVGMTGVWQTDRSMVVVWGPMICVVRRTDIRRITYGRFSNTNSRLCLCIEGPVGRLVAIPGRLWRNKERELDAYIALCQELDADMEGEAQPIPTGWLPSDHDKRLK